MAKTQGPTYNPSKIKRIRKFGFRKRNSTQDGKNVLKRRMQKGRHNLTASFLNVGDEIVFIEGDDLYFKGFSCNLLSLSEKSLEGVDCNGVKLNDSNRLVSKASERRLEIINSEDVQVVDSITLPVDEIFGPYFLKNSKLIYSVNKLSSIGGQVVELQYQVRLLDLNSGTVSLISEFLPVEEISELFFINNDYFLILRDRGVYEVVRFNSELPLSYPGSQWEDIELNNQLIEEIELL